MCSKVVSQTYRLITYYLLLTTPDIFFSFLGFISKHVCLKASWIDPDLLPWERNGDCLWGWKNQESGTWWLNYRFRSTKFAFYVVCTHPISPEISKHVQQNTNRSGDVDIFPNPPIICCHLNLGMSRKFTSSIMIILFATTSPGNDSVLWIKRRFYDNYQDWALSREGTNRGSRELSPFVLRAYQFFVKVTCRKKIGYNKKLAGQFKVGKLREVSSPS